MVKKESKRLIIGIDFGSTAIKIHDGETTLIIESVVAEEPPQEARDIAAAAFSSNNTSASRAGTPTLRLKLSHDGPTFLFGEGARHGINPLYLGDDNKDAADTQHFLDAGLVALADGADEIHAKIATHAPINDYFKGEIPANLKRLLEGQRVRYVGNRKIVLNIEVLEVGPESLAVMYFLQSRRQLARGTAYKVIDFGGRTMDLAYLYQQKLQPRYSRHFEGGLDQFLVDAVSDYLARMEVFDVDRARVRAAIRDDSKVYLTDGRVIQFQSVLEPAAERYAQKRLNEITSLWRSVPADQLIVHGGATHPVILDKLLRQFPKATIVQEEFARIANAIGLYHRANALSAKPGVKEEKATETTRG